MVRYNNLPKKPTKVQNLIAWVGRKNNIHHRANENIADVHLLKERGQINHLVTFTSSDETIAAVDENGLVTPGKPGAVTITATADSGVSASCTVIVTDLAYTFSILPTGLNMIEEEVFAGLAFEAVIIPEGCILIGPRAFADCVNLVYIRIPDSMTEIAGDAFEGCPNVVINCGTQ